MSSVVSRSGVKGGSTSAGLPSGFRPTMAESNSTGSTRVCDWSSFRDLSELNDQLADNPCPDLNSVLFALTSESACVIWDLR